MGSARRCSRSCRWSSRSKRRTCFRSASKARWVEAQEATHAQHQETARTSRRPEHVQGARYRGKHRAYARHHGTERLREEHACGRTRRTRRLRGHAGQRPLPGTGFAGHEPGGSRPRGCLPGLPVPGRDSRRQQRLSAQGRAQRDTQATRRAVARCLRVPGPGTPEVATDADGRESPQPQRQRRFFRRREKAERDPADGRARANARGVGRDRFGSRHRCAPGRGRRGQHDARSCARDRAGHALPAAAHVRGARCGPRAARGAHPALRRRRTCTGAGGAWLRLGPPRGSRGMNARSGADPVERWREALERATPNDGTFSSQRAEAFARFAREGFPGARDEEWKYTSLRRLAARDFAPAAPEHAPAPTVRGPALPAPLRPAPPFGPHRAVLVNGYLHTAASRLDTCPVGLRVRSLGRAGGEAGRAAWLRVPAGGGTARFAALNAAFCGDALLIEADRPVTTDAVLHLQIDALGDEATMSHPRVLVRLAASAGLRLVVHYRGDDRAERFVNAVIDVDAGERSELQIYRLQEQGAKSFQIERIEAALAREARLVVRDASLGGSLARLDLRARLAGRGAAGGRTRALPPRGR